MAIITVTTMTTRQKVMSEADKEQNIYDYIKSQYITTYTNNNDYNIVNDNHDNRTTIIL